MRVGVLLVLVAVVSECECIVLRVAVQGTGCVFAAARASVVLESFVFKLQTWRQAGARSGARLPPPGPPALAPGGTS
eukprot:scaffold4193_cov110-Isochrysis_galbana.AAC.5